jgi:hypothetical protein
MIASRVVSEQELLESLAKQGFEITTERTDTGTFWRHAASRNHILVPESVQGFYPDWLLWDIHDQIRRVRSL